MVALLSDLDERNNRLGLNVEILGANPDADIPGLKGPRARCEAKGILQSDVILVPLEDGDRCQALVAMGKTVIVIDLNPLSRSSQTGTITIVNEVTRCITEMIDSFDSELPLLSDYNHEKVLQAALDSIVHGMKGRFKSVE